MDYNKKNTDGITAPALPNYKQIRLEHLFYTNREEHNLTERLLGIYLSNRIISYYTMAFLSNGGEKTDTERNLE